jgi:hypothetical protein
MKYPNAAWALSYKRIVYMDAAAALGISGGTFSQKMAGRVEFAPHERARLAELLGFREEWLFAEMAIPPSARMQPAMAQATA